MSEEILSEFTEELIKRSESVPKDLIEKYTKLGLSESEIASALLARSAVKGPTAPQSAVEKSEGRLNELVARASERADEGSAVRTSLLSKLVQTFRKLFRAGNG